MLRPNPPTSWRRGGAVPRVSPRAFVDETAVLIGEVIVEDDVLILPYAVLRADEGAPIHVGAGTNIQDGVIVHALLGSDVRIGRRCALAHAALVHGPCTIEDGCFVGFRAVVFRARIGAGCFIGHGAVVTDVELPPGTSVPAGAVVDGEAAVRHLRPVTPDQHTLLAEVLKVNAELLAGYLELRFSLPQAERDLGRK